MDGYRRASRGDLPAVLDLIERGFSVQGDKYSDTEGKEHRVLFSYLYSRPNWRPEWLYLAERDRRIVAAAGCFPQILNFEGIPIPVWAISPVVTDPKYRGDGLAGSCLMHMLSKLPKEGVPAVFLWGLPSYYPKLGFVPVLPRYKTRINPRQINRTGDQIQGRFRLSSVCDLESIANLYSSYDRKLWLHPQRKLDWWRERFTEMNIELATIKEVPFPQQEQFLVWENSSGRVAGYLHYSSDSNQKIIIKESLTKSLNEAVFLLQNFTFQYLRADQSLYIQGTPEHPLNMAAYNLGGTHLNPAPLAGMVKIIDWRKLFMLLTPLFESRLAKLFPQNNLKSDWQWNVGDLPIRFIYQEQTGLTVEIAEKADLSDKKHNQLITKLVLGLYDDLDLEIIHLDRLNEHIRVLFPPKYPFIWDANYLY